VTATTPLDAPLQPDAAVRVGRSARRLDDRNAGLDLLRSIACLLVVFYHLRHVLRIDFGPLNGVFEDSDTGVFIFFALSGYLLYRPFLLAPVDMRTYALKRSARIVPAYFIALVCLAVLTGSRLPIDHLGAYATLTAPYNLELRGFLGNAWTLSAEVLFYVSLPLLARFAAAAPFQRLLLIGLVSAGANLLYVSRFYGPETQWLFRTFPFVLYAFVPGMVLAVVEIRHPSAFRRLAAPWVPLAGVGLLLAQIWTQIGTFTVLGTAIGAALLIGWLRSVHVPFARALAFAGGASYALYLWHQDMIESFGLLGVLIAVAGAAASWAFIERPVLELAHRVAATWRRPVIDVQLPGEVPPSVSAT
jgi:peptidoglycan/LPS O-acetylase OafA/YrhL